MDSYEKIINEVNKKSALNLSFKNAEKRVIKEVKIKQIIKHNKIAKKGGKFWKCWSKIAQMNPEKYIWPSPPRLYSPHRFKIPQPTPAIM